MEIIAHRGNINTLYKENTMDSFLCAFQNPDISGIELDVRMTKDHKFVIIHNSLINLTSDGSGFVKNMTLKELRKYNFGTKEHPSKISTLKEVLQVAPSNKRILIELKEEGNVQKYDLKRFYHEVKPFLKKRLWIFSFHEPFIRMLHQNYPTLKVGICISSMINRSYLNHGFSFQVVSHHLAKETDPHKINFFWTVNKQEDLNKIKRGYQGNTFGIITDHPTLFISHDDLREW